MCTQLAVSVGSCHGVGRIIFWYPAHIYSSVLVPTAIQQFSFPAQCFFDHEILSLGNTHLFTSNIPYSKSTPNFLTITPSNRANPYDHNGAIFVSVPILEVAGYLFMHFYLAIPSIPDAHYTSFERSFQGDPDAVAIV